MDRSPRAPKLRPVGVPELKTWVDRWISYVGVFPLKVDKSG